MARLTFEIFKTILVMLEPYEDMCPHSFQLLEKSYDYIMEVYKQFFMPFLDMSLRSIKFVYNKVFELYPAMCYCSYFLVDVFKTIYDLEIAWHLILTHFAAFGISPRRSFGLQSVVMLLFPQST